MKQVDQLSLAEQIDFAAQLLEQGQVVGMPTETVYGLAARIDLPFAVEKIFSTKRRPFFDPLIVHVSSLDQAKSLFQTWTPLMQSLAEEFWPGPLTLVGPKQHCVNHLITSGLPSVGVRWPQHPVAQKLLQKTGVPLAAPSANLFGELSPTSAQNVRDVFGKSVFVLDGGACEVGIESTIIHVEGSRVSLLRPGVLTLQEIESHLQQTKQVYEIVSPQKKIAPGQMKHHYMPSVPLILYSGQTMTEVEIAKRVMQELKNIPDEVEHVRILKPAKVQKMIQLSLSDDPVFAAREVYASLRTAAEQKPDVIYFKIKNLHSQPEWNGVMDRLNKAASLHLK